MTQNPQIPLIVVAGPTASGKTALAVQLALRLGGEVVSADSMQIYKGMDIATAKPSLEEQAGIPHHLLDFLGQDETYSVAQYCEAAHKTIEQIHQRGKLPIVAGGTGLYISSLVDCIDFSPQKEDPELRAELLELARLHGGQHLLEMLAGFDPEAAARLHPNNLGRIVRAIEVYRLTGVTMSRQLELSRKRPSPYKLCMLGLDFRDRSRLYDRINTRVDAMLKAGLVQEATEVLSRPISKTALQAIGYKELIPFLEGTETLEACAEQLKQNTRRYAKRQLTWFRRDQRIHWLFPDEVNCPETLIQAAADTISQAHEQQT